MSSSSTGPEALAYPVSILQYRDIADRQAATAKEERRGSQDTAKTGISEEELSARIRMEREQAAREVEARLRSEYEGKLLSAQSLISDALKRFGDQRSEYFGKVEAEVVQLSLSIAAKILHRESQVDPMLLAALVRVAIERMKETTSVTIRVNASQVAAWKRYFSALPELARVEVMADDKLNERDCVLDTEVGSANFAIDKQLKEIEQGFFDLLALRPSR